MPMVDIRSAAHESLGDAFSSRTGVWITALVVVVLLLGSCVLSTHRPLAAALRVAGLLMALMGLTIGVHTHGWVTGLDAVTTSWFVAHHSAGLVMAATLITNLGSPVATAAAALICGVVLSWRARSMIRGVVVVGTVAAAGLANEALKAVVERPRSAAELQLPLQTDHSFPSGHVTGTAALLGIVAVCMGAGRSRTVRAWLGGSVITGVLVIAITRLYLGVHWLTDIIAAPFLAGVFVTLGAAVLDALHARSGQDGTTRPVTAPPVKTH